METRKYYIPVKVVQQSYIVVEASNPDDAYNMVVNGEGEEDVVDLVAHRARHSDVEWEYCVEDMVVTGQAADLDANGLVE